MLILSLHNGQLMLYSCESSVWCLLNSISHATAILVACFVLNLDFMLQNVVLQVVWCIM